MSLTENPKPGPHANAMRAVAARARDADDARDLMEHLGLVDPRAPTPVWRRANKPKAAPAPREVTG